MNNSTERIKRDQFNGMDSIQIYGAFDFSDDRFVTIAVEIIKDGKTDLVIDFKYTTYITSTGIAQIVKIYKKIQTAQGRLFVANATDDMISLIRLARLDKYVQFIA